MFLVPDFYDFFQPLTLDKGDLIKLGHFSFLIYKLRRIIENT